MKSRTRSKKDSFSDKQFIFIFISLLLFVFFSSVYLLLNKKAVSQNQIYSQEAGFPSYDFEVKTINPGQNLSFVLNTNEGDINDLSNGTPIEFTILNRKELTTSNSAMFGFAGVQGQWDITNTHLTYHKKYFNQENDLTLTPLKMLEKHMAMHAALGAEWIGMEFYWTQIGESDPVKFFNFDKIFRMAKKYNLNILPMMDKTPRWATDLTCTNDTTDGYPSCRAGTKCVPRDLTDNGSQYYNNFVSQAVERYKPHGQYYQDTGESDDGYGITHWVVWNEPNHASGTFWTDCAQATTIFKNSSGQDINQYDAGYRPLASIEDYGKLFKGAYNSIKQADSNATVLVAGFAGIGPTDSNKKIENMEKFYTELNRINSPKPDLWNAHIYQAHANNFMWEMGTIVNSRNQLDTNKEIWVTEYGFYRAFHMPNIQEAIVSDLFSKKNQLLSWNVRKLLYWTTKGYIMCNPDIVGCIPYTDIATCRSFPYTGCGEKPYGNLENGTLLMSPNFYPDPAYLNYGEELGTITQVGGNIQTSVVNGQINVNIPASNLSDGQEYLLLMSSPSKIVTTKPWIIRVGDLEPTPTSTPTPTVTSTPTPTPTASPTPTPTSTPTPTPATYEIRFTTGTIPKQVLQYYSAGSWASGNRVLIEIPDNYQGKIDNVKLKLKWVGNNNLSMLISKEDGSHQQEVTRKVYNDNSGWAKFVLNNYEIIPGEKYYIYLYREKYNDNLVYWYSDVHNDPVYDQTHRNHIVTIINGEPVSTPTPTPTPTSTPTPTPTVSPTPTLTPASCPTQCPNITYEKLGCTTSGCNLRLNWNAVSGATRYDIYRNSTKYGSDITNTTYIFSWIPTSTANFKVIPEANGCTAVSCSGLYINPQ
jgi:putative glycosyl hydrolase